MINITDKKKSQKNRDRGNRVQSTSTYVLGSEDILKQTPSLSTVR